MNTAQAMMPGVEEPLPRRWVSPRKRRAESASILCPDPIHDEGISPRAVVLEARLQVQYPQSFCCWPDMDTIAEEQGYPESSLYRLMGELVRAHRVVRVPFGKFKKWFKETGGPKHGLEWPVKLKRKSNTVTIFVRRLPAELRDPAYSWPVATRPGSEARHLSNVRRDNSQSRESPSFECSGTSEERIESNPRLDSTSSACLDSGKERTMAEQPPCPPAVASPPIGTDASTTPPDDRSQGLPGASPEVLPEAIPREPFGDAERDEQIALLSSSWKTFRTSAWWALLDAGQLPPDWGPKCPGERPPAEPPPRTDATDRPALSQGKPVRVPGRPSPEPAKPTVITDELEAAARALPRLAGKSEHERAMACDALAAMVAEACKQPNTAPSFKAKVKALADGDETAHGFLRNLHEAVSRGRNPGAYFNSIKPGGKPR